MSCENVVKTTTFSLASG